MKKLLLVTLVILANLVQVSVAETQLPIHVIEVEKVDGLNVADGLLGLDEILNVDRVENEYYEFVTYEDLGVTEQEFWMLVYTVSAEARGESQEGRYWVVYTILNRVAHPSFDNDIVSVIESPNQFSGRWVDNYGLYYDENVQDVVDAITLWNSGELTVEYDILYFNAFNDVDSEYAGRYGLRLIREIGNHRFYGRI